MIGATIVMQRIRWDDPAWVQMHLPGGMVFNWTAENTREASSFARMAAPVRTGRLKRTVRGDNRTSGPHSIRSYLRAGSALAPYARYVLEGTLDRAPIRPHGNYLQIRAEYNVGGKGNARGKDYPANYLGNNGVPTFAYAKQVRGQKANNFLLRAAVAQMAKISAGAK